MKKMIGLEAIFWISEAMWLLSSNFPASLSVNGEKNMGRGKRNKIRR